MKKLICKDCGHEGKPVNISVFSKILGFLFIVAFISFLMTAVGVAEKGTAATMADNAQVGGLFIYCVFNFVIYWLFKKKGCPNCKSRKLIPIDSPLGKKLKEEI